MNVFEFEKLKVTVDESDKSQIKFVFTGDVDETFEHARLPRYSNSDVLFDLSGIEHFNSCGIREWIHFIRDYVKADCQVVFDRCSVAVVDQINMVPDTAQGTSILSFAAPYYCEDHGEVIHEIDMKSNMGEISQKIAPKIDCPQCKVEMEFDALEESYFLFIDDMSLRSAS